MMRTEEWQFDVLRTAHPYTEESAIGPVPARWLDWTVTIRRTHAFTKEHSCGLAAGKALLFRPWSISTKRTQREWWAPRSAKCTALVAGTTMHTTWSV